MELIQSLPNLVAGFRYTASNSIEEVATGRLYPIIYRTLPPLPRGFWAYDPRDISFYRIRHLGRNRESGLPVFNMRGTNEPNINLILPALSAVILRERDILHVNPGIHIPMALEVVQQFCIYSLRYLHRQLNENQRALVAEFTGGPVPPDLTYLFFLKGGMALSLYKSASIPLRLEAGAGNDWDMSLLINPALDPGLFERFRLFLMEKVRTILQELSSIGGEIGAMRTLIDPVSSGTGIGSITLTGESKTYTALSPTGVPTTYTLPPGPFTMRYVDNIQYRNGSGSPVITHTGLVSLALDIPLRADRPHIKTPLIDISIPHQRYPLLSFDYALYREHIVGMNGFLVADPISLLFDQSVAKAYNSRPEKRARRNTRIRNIKNSLLSQNNKDHIPRIKDSLVAYPTILRTIEANLT